MESEFPRSSMLSKTSGDDGTVFEQNSALSGRVSSPKFQPNELVRDVLTTQTFSELCTNLRRRFSNICSDSARGI